MTAEPISEEAAGSLLAGIRHPDDIHLVPPGKLPRLADEIRAELLAVISRQGGHLASNLGVVELTIALLHTFSPATDKLVWDTGHQAYVYKLLTGRREFFKTLRQDDGCGGFLSREESPYDHFGAGHAGTAISAALGFAAARDRLGGTEKVVAVVGDGAIGNGISLEGLNNIVESTHDFVLVLNDNKMSIAPNVGALSRYFNRIISGRSYNRVKKISARLVERIPWIGRRLRRGIRRVEEAAKSVVVPGGLFEDFGLRYIGPIDGHNLSELVETFQSIASLSEPILVHVLTEKGHGYRFAEEQPESFHGAGSFDTLSGLPVQAVGAPPSPVPSFSAVFGREIGAIMDRDERVVVITAGMCKGTGLEHVRQRFPERFYDVGIAEEHAVVFAAGLAAAGMRPCVAVYATFMHRAVDCVLHDVCLQNLPVLFCLDRSGIVQDGPTHHGIHDLAYWHGMPNLLVRQAADGEELAAMMQDAMAGAQPCVIRYAKGDADGIPGNGGTPFAAGQAAILRAGGDLSLWCLGRECATGLAVAEILAAGGVHATVVNVRSIQPFDRERLREQARRMPVVTIEDHSLAGGIAGIVDGILSPLREASVLHFGWPAGEIIPHGSDQGIRTKYGMTPARIAADIQRFLSGL